MSITVQTCEAVGGTSSTHKKKIYFHCIIGGQNIYSKKGISPHTLETTYHVYNIYIIFLYIFHYRTSKYLKGATLTRSCAIGGFFISIPLFLIGKLLLNGPTHLVLLDVNRRFVSWRFAQRRQELEFGIKLRSLMST